MCEHSLTAKCFRISLLSLLISSSVLLAESTDPADKRARSIIAVKTASPPVIDGRIDDECWLYAQITSDFTEEQYQRPATKQTFVRLLYDDQFMYIAFECLEPEPQKIHAMERRDDRLLRDDDRIDVRIDTFHDRRTAYIFSANTLGTRWDARQGLFGIDDNWDSDWLVQCTIAADRWYAEIAIPIADMHFEKKTDAEWGINFFRIDKVSDEYSDWSYLNTKPYMPRNFGVVTGLDLSNVRVSQEPSYEVYVSNTAKLRQAGTLKADGGSNELSTGIDAAMRLNSQWVAQFTINPDFGQVEADPDTIELRDTERFLPERRAFFREGAELFETPLVYYYSRRIVDIDAGAKITGNGSDWSFGAIDVVGKIQRNDRMTDGNHNIGRFIKYIGDDSHVGTSWTVSSREDGTNTVTGADTRIFLNEDTWFSGQAVGMWDTKGVEVDEGMEKSGYGMFYGLNGGRKPINWNFQYLDVTESFVPDLGYIPRRDIRGPAGSIFYNDDIDQGNIRWIGFFTDFDYYLNHDGQVTYKYFRQMGGIRFNNEVEFRYYRSDRYLRPYYNRSNLYILNYNRVDMWNSVAASYEQGVYEAEPYNEYGIEKPIKLTDRFTTQFEADYRTTSPDEGDDRTEWLWRWVTQYTWPWNGTVKFTAEDTRVGRYNFTLLFSWEINNNTDYYFVFTDYKVAEDELPERGVFSKIVFKF